MIPLINQRAGSGGGIGGLTCAVTLSKYPDIDVDIYEAGPSFTQNGPGCGVWLRTWNILRKLGLDVDLAKIAGSQPTDNPGNSLDHLKGRDLTHATPKLPRSTFAKAIVLKEWISSA
jgi:salicylate hydroxylase